MKTYFSTHIFTSESRVIHKKLSDLEKLYSSTEVRVAKDSLNTVDTKSVKKEDFQSDVNAVLNQSKDYATHYLPIANKEFWYKTESGISKIWRSLNITTKGKADYAYTESTRLLYAKEILDTAKETLNKDMADAESKEEALEEILNTKDTLDSPILRALGIGGGAGAGAVAVGVIGYKFLYNTIVNNIGKIAGGVAGAAGLAGIGALLIKNFESQEKRMFRKQMEFLEKETEKVESRLDSLEGKVEALSEKTDESKESIESFITSQGITDPKKQEMFFTLLSYNIVSLTENQNNPLKLNTQFKTRFKTLDPKVQALFDNDEKEAQNIVNTLNISMKKLPKSVSSQFVKRMANYQKKGLFLKDDIEHTEKNLKTFTKETIDERDGRKPKDLMTIKGTSYMFLGKEKNGIHRFLVDPATGELHTYAGVDTGTLKKFGNTDKYPELGEYIKYIPLEHRFSDKIRKHIVHPGLQEHHKVMEDMITEIQTGVTPGMTLEEISTIEFKTTYDASLNIISQSLESTYSDIPGGSGALKTATISLNITQGHTDDHIAKYLPEFFERTPTRRITKATTPPTPGTTTTTIDI